ncbi:hypothetical protein BJX63DRAFT_442171 [Aspergillus granulosus]|uniref:Integral membrane protein n=1 Tax=Aspergillus granulosus TaxID=176169 RepID=A0ABR4GRA5_9EURO
MASFFQKHKYDNREGEGESYEQHLPTETTRVLRRHNEPFLRPDDPAVSPYNLWSVRALRGLSSTFLAISLVWWTFLLVSLFVSAPALYSRGSGFFAFAYTTLTVGYLLFGIIFFSVPSEPMTAWIGTVVWATIIAVYNVVQNRYVAWGKREEEERLTGREETRRSLWEWLAVLTEILFMVAITVISILFMVTLILRACDASLKAPGEKYYVSAHNYQVHLNCVGDAPRTKDTPTVLLEAGGGPVEHTMQPFIDELYRKGAIIRYCYWDRPGMAWSDNAPSPFSAVMASDALSEALAFADEEGPWVLISAGIGSIYSLIFASRHLLKVEGIFLIDPLHEDYLSDIARSYRGFAFWLRGIFSPLGLDTNFGAIFSGRTREDRVFGRSAYQTGKFIRAKLQENLVAGSMMRSEIEAASHVQMADMPLTIKWASKQEDHTNITKNLKNWDIVKDAPHEVWKTTEGRRVLEKRLREMVRKK